MDTGKRGRFPAPSDSDTHNLDAVRALHQTVVSLRAALDKSRAELQELRSKVQSQVDTSIYRDTIEKLSLENHILRSRVLANGKVAEYVDSLTDILLKPNLLPIESNTKHMDQSKTVPDELKVGNNDNVKDSARPAVKTAEDLTVSNVQEVSAKEDANEVNQLQRSTLEEKEDEGGGENKICTEKLEHRESSIRSEDGDHSVGSETSQQDGGPQQVAKTAGDSDNESEELDDIELIFTTEETKELGVLQEDLVSITETEVWHPSGNATLYKHPRVENVNEVAEEEDDDEVFPKDGVDEKEVPPSNLTKIWTQSVLVETDISKCGVVDDIDVTIPLSRRNTLPNPLMYHTVLPREPLANKVSIGPSPLSPRPFAVKFAASSGGPQSQRNGRLELTKSAVRPILIEKNAVKRESEAQTDITALPSQWKSESYLAHKVSHNFTTLPSKFAMPIQQMVHPKYSLRLSEKTQEARRTLLSDINFTSMVPELSRSADHLCQEDTEQSIQPANMGLCRNYPRAFSYMKNGEVMSPSYAHSRDYGKDPWSPCSCTQYGGSQLYHRYQGSLSSMSGPLSYEALDPRRRHSWRPSYDSYQSSTLSQKPAWGSVPSSPTHGRRSRSMQFAQTPCSDVNLYSCASGRELQFSSSSLRSGKLQPSKSRSRNKVTFEESSLRRVPHPGQSLPDLRADIDFDSGNSTDSLIDEAEEYLRRSIDSILTGTDWSRVGRRRQARKHSEPDQIRELVPPRSARPFLPKIPRDLKLDYMVKVISAEGRVMMGRVRYVGGVPGRAEPHVGVELPRDSGDSDGSFQGRRFFDCDPGKAMFVPFKKVVMAWST
ncbi:uncharacterized protein LOC134543304 isoform X1 [Bacillus rossius redtenbacheri]|uniref:uncharacterized protein LOC134543304 isoform X1 n=1 Tax=Bacillus rossius redtenbacheri TaxID=93214 RepID=UPI002FDE7217